MKMKKEKAISTAKEAVNKSVEETAAAVKKVSEAVTKENIEKTIDAVKKTAQTVKTRATKAAESATTTVKKTAPPRKLDPNIYIQYGSKEISKEVLLDKFKETWIKEHKINEIKTLDLYYKVDDDTAYFLVNGTIEINIQAF